MRDAGKDMTIGDYAESLGLTLTVGQLASAGREARERSLAVGAPIRFGRSGNNRKNHYAVAILAGLNEGLLAMADAGPGAKSGPIPGGLLWSEYRAWTRHVAVDLVDAVAAGADPARINALAVEVLDWVCGLAPDQEPESADPGPTREAPDMAAAVDAMIDAVLATREADDDDDPANGATLAAWRDDLATAGLTIDGLTPSLFIDDPADADAWLTVREFAVGRGFVMADGQLASIGHEASRRCRSGGVEPARKFDGRRPANAYPPDVLAAMADGIKAIADAGFDAVEGPLPDGGWWRVWRPWSSAEGDRAQAV